MIEEILNGYKDGTLNLQAAIERLHTYQLQHLDEDLGHTVLDLDRERRTGASEVVFGSGKTPQQVHEIVQQMHAHGSNVLVTRLTPDQYAQIPHIPNAHYDSTSRLLTLLHHPPQPAATQVAVVTAGTSDIAVAEEAAQTAEFYGNRVTRVFDVGVAGLHRLLARLPALRGAKVLIVVAGMEGALPSVVGGLVDKPVIAVPTSVGYGAAFDGVTALLGMLTSCASGVSVVNIDNGFGAGYLANTINRL